MRIAIDDFGTGLLLPGVPATVPGRRAEDRPHLHRRDRRARPRQPPSSTRSSRSASTLGLETVAEGIERSDQLQLLQQNQCDSGQGFLFSAPIEADAVGQFLARWAAEPPSDTSTAEPQASGL